MPAIRVMLVDNHQMFRAGIRALLQTVGGVEVVAEAGDGREALRHINTTKEIAKELGISPKTAESYRAELRKELDIHDIASLARHPIRMGVVALDP